MNRRSWVALLTGSALLAAFLVIAPRFHTPPWLHWLGPFLLAAGVSFTCLPVLRWLAPRAGLVDLPDARKHHHGAVPLVGGMAIYLGFLATNLYYGYMVQSLEIRGIMLAGLLLIIVGVADDRFDLPAFPKLLVQLGAVVIVMSSGVQFTFLPDTWWGIPIAWATTAIWLIGLTNALNFLDGLDGLATSLTVVAATAFALVALQTDQPFFLLLCAALAGGCIGFLPYNFRRRPASAFLGDSGATLLGFLLASIAIVGEWGGTRSLTLDIVVPLLILGVPVFDTSFITFTRIADGRIRTFRQWLEYTGRDHIHHRLLDLGLNRIDAVGFLCVISCVLALSALTLHHATGLLAVLSLLQAVIILTVVARFMLFMEHRHDRGTSPDSEH
jgi:UDP-GlcNAc:undecaprenyl-phosphate/decaprenyl-phosphate GlcNAc-1-phosphate transferase